MSRYAWNHARFTAQCFVLGITDYKQLAARINKHRGPDAKAIPLQTAHRYWSGRNDPTISAPGKMAAVFELAEVLGVTPDWLTSGVSS